MNDEAACQGRPATNESLSRSSIASASDVQAVLEDFGRGLRRIDPHVPSRMARRDIEQEAGWCRQVDAAVRVGQLARARTGPMFIAPEERRAA
jgi:hypothetical protein